MIQTIAKQKFLSNILTFRFTVSFIICEVLFVASALVLTSGYTERQEQYRTNVQRHNEALQNIHTYALLHVGLDRTPEPLSILCAGADRRLGSSVTVAFDAAPTIIEAERTRNPLLTVFPSLDLTAVIQIILSLLVLLFSYNTISGERESGTLRLLLSNSVPRHTVILGNFIGGMASLILPLCIGLISAILIIIINPMVQVSIDFFQRIFLLILLAILYLSSFYLLGIFVSSRIRRSATVLIVLLFIWVVFVAILPHTAAYLGRLVVKVTDRTVVDNQAQALRNEWQNELWRYVQTHPRPQHDWDFIRDRRVMTGDWAYSWGTWYAHREVMKWLYEGSVYGHTLRMEYEDRIYQLYKAYQFNLKKQVDAARVLSLLSPSWVFYHISESISGTSAANYLRFLDQTQSYRQELIQYMKNKGAFSSHLLMTRRPIESFLTLDELKTIRETRGRAAINDILGNGFAEADGLDISDLPRFKYKITGMLKSILNVLPEILILMFLNFIFFSLTWVSFLRQDVR